MGHGRKRLTQALGLCIAALAGLYLFPRVPVAAVAYVFPEAVFYAKTDERVVAITIDDGPDPSTTLEIVDVLRAHELPATFFMIGEREAAEPQLVADVQAHGYEIGAQFYTDEATFLLSEAEVVESLDRTLLALPDGVQFVRPGHGLPSRAALNASKARGLNLIVGDIPAMDTFLSGWAFETYLWLVLRPGAMITLHDGGARGVRTAQTLPKVIRMLEKRGFTVLPLAELASMQEALRYSFRSDRS